MAALIMSPAQYDAMNLRDAIKGPGINEKKLNEILICRKKQVFSHPTTLYPHCSTLTLQDLDAVKKAYEEGMPKCYLLPFAICCTCMYDYIYACLSCSAYGSDLESDIKGSTGRGYGKICLQLLNEEKPSGDQIDKEAANAAAENILQVGKRIKGRSIKCLMMFHPEWKGFGKEEGRCLD
jgi:hypothetical protein